MDEVQRKMKSLDINGTIVDSINNQFKTMSLGKRLVGNDVQDDDDFYVIDCTGVDQQSNQYVKLRVKRQRQ